MWVYVMVLAERGVPVSLVAPLGFESVSYRHCIRFLRQYPPGDSYLATLRASSSKGVYKRCYTQEPVVGAGGGAAVMV